MTRRPPRSSLIAAVFVVALLAAAGSAQAIVWCEHLFPFGVINGAQIARVDAVLTDPVDDVMSCPMELTFPVEVSFHDRRGTMVGDTTLFTLAQGVIESADFRGDRSVPLGQRMENRATVMIGDPDILPPGPCKAEVHLSLQVFDRLTMRTQYILTEKVMLDVAGRLP